MVEMDSWMNLSAALDRVLSGERDAEALAVDHDLDGVDCLILTKILEALDASPVSGAYDDGGTK